MQACGIPDYRILRPLTKAKFRETRSVNSLGARLDYVIGGERYVIVTSLQDYDVCTTPTRFYVKIDRKKKEVIGAY
jgi:hypothetical protein